MKSNSLALAGTLSVAIAISGIAKAETHSSSKNKIICETKAICQKLSRSIQAQINELEAKGLSNLSRQERVKYSQLTDDLIALENNRQSFQQETIANERAETSDIQKTNQKLDELRGILLEE